MHTVLYKAAVHECLGVWVHGKSTLLQSISGAAVDAASGVTSSNICVNPKQRFGMLEQTAVSVSGMLVRDKVISAFGYMLGTCLGVYA